MFKTNGSFSKTIVFKNGNTSIFLNSENIQDFDESFYRGFHLVVSGLDSIVAR